MHRKHRCGAMRGRNDESGNRARKLSTGLFNNHLDASEIQPRSNTESTHYRHYSFCNVVPMRMNRRVTSGTRLNEDSARMCGRKSQAESGVPWGIGLDLTARLEPVLLDNPSSVRAIRRRVWPTGTPGQAQLRKSRRPGSIRKKQKGTSFRKVPSSSEM
jgi:hypothetical protein